MLGLAAVGLGIAFMLGFRIVLMAAAIVPIMVIYPAMKRITWWPQLFLGLAFNWGAILGYARGLEMTGQGDVPWAMIYFPSWLLYAAGIFWTLGYDTIYAHQDRAEDQSLGIGSTALYWGEAKYPLFLCYAVSLGLLGLAGLAAHRESLTLMMMAVGVGLHFTWQILSLDPNHRGNCARRFRSNFTVGWVVTLGLLAASINGIVP